jgi:hypothetical protein
MDVEIVAQITKMSPAVGRGVDDRKQLSNAMAKDGGESRRELPASDCPLIRFTKRKSTGKATQPSAESDEQRQDVETETFPHAAPLAP